MIGGFKIDWSQGKKNTCHNLKGFFMLSSFSATYCARKSH